MKIFFAGPLTNLNNAHLTKAFYVKMADVARVNGFEFYWAFQRGTDPESDPTVPASRIYEIDSTALKGSDLVIAYVGEPSIGTGIEIELAKTHNIPVYLMYEKDKKVSRMLLGSPIIKGSIIFNDETDALAQLATLLKNLKQSS